MPHLFDPLTIRGLTLANRIVVSPMCQYLEPRRLRQRLASSCISPAAPSAAPAWCSPRRPRSRPTAGSAPRTSASGAMRTSRAFRRIARFVKGAGQRAPASSSRMPGARAAHQRPWDGQLAPSRPAEGGWQPVGPTAEPFASDYPMPRAMIRQRHRGHRRRVSRCGGARPRRRLRRRRGARGARLSHSRVPVAAQQHAHRRLRRVVRQPHPAVSRGRGRRAAASGRRRAPLFVRISATDWADGGWDIEQSVELARLSAGHGVDLIDCSSGGNVARAQDSARPGISGAVRRAHPARGRRRDRRRRV